MGIKASQLCEHVIRPVLKHMDMWSTKAEDLLLLTAAQESGMGTYLKQTDGPALGIYQMEIATANDVWRYLGGNPRLLALVSHYCVQVYNIDQLIWNLAYATAMCRIRYWMVPDPLPTTLEGLAAYWKKYYNTVVGKGTADEALKSYIKYVIHEEK